MITDIQAMREKICELGRLLYDHKLTDAAYVLLRSGALSASVPEAPGLAARASLLKEEIA